MSNKLWSSVQKGAYAGGTAYTVGDFVTYSGSSYTCILNSTGNLPNNGTYWALIASVGSTGATGAQGVAGNTGATGAIGMNWLGAYAGGTSYVPTDGVSYNGSSYICILASTGNVPTNGTYWNLVALKGTDGAGAGTVTDVSIVTANGVSGSVATSTSTPAITLTLGAITPSSVTTTGNIELGNASDTTLARVSAGVVSIEGNNILTAATGLPLAGGTLTGKIVTAGSSEAAATYAPSSGAQTVALDCALHNIHEVTGNASGTAITFTIANVVNSECFMVSILQGSGTVSTIAGWFATVRWAGGAAPTLTATLDKRDTFGFRRTGANTYDGFIIGQNC